MKLSLIFSLFAAASVSAEEGNVRKRTLASAGGSINTPNCFSEVANVQVFGKGPVAMKDLQVGDRIFTGETYQSVYAFAHMDKSTEADFVQIRLEHGNTLEATGAHLVYVDELSGPVRADSVQVGDVLQGAAVTQIGSVQRTGLYAPLTMDGTLIVDGVKASNYVSLEQADAHSLFGKSVHGFSHFGISPFRLLCTGVSSKVCEAYNDEGVPAVLAFVHTAFEWFMDLPFVFQTMAIVAYLMVAAMTWTMECILFAPTTPMVMMAVAGGLVVSKAMGVRIQASKAKSI